MSWMTMAIMFSCMPSSAGAAGLFLERIPSRAEAIIASVSYWSGGSPDERIMPAAVVVINDDTVRLDWSVATAGRVYVV